MTEHMGMRRKKIMAGAAMYALLGLLASLVLIPVLWWYHGVQILRGDHRQTAQVGTAADIL